MLNSYWYLTQFLYQKKWDNVEKAFPKNRHTTHKNKSVFSLYNPLLI